MKLMSRGEAAHAQMYLQFTMINRVSEQFFLARNVISSMHGASAILQ